MSSAAYIASHHILHLTLPLPLAYHGNPARETESVRSICFHHLCCALLFPRPTSAAMTFS